MEAFAKASPIKTDRLDAGLIAQAMRAGLFKVAHAKRDYSQRIRLLLRHRQAMVCRNRDLINTVRGTLKAFGIRTGGGKNTLFAKRVREAIDDKAIPAMTEPLLIAYEEGLRTLAELDEMVLAIAKSDTICRRLMTVPGVGPVSGGHIPHRCRCRSSLRQIASCRRRLWPYPEGPCFSRSRTSRADHQMRRCHGPSAAL